VNVAWSAGATALICVAHSDGNFGPPEIREGSAPKIPVVSIRRKEAARLKEGMQVQLVFGAAARDAACIQSSTPAPSTAAPQEDTAGDVHSALRHATPGGPRPPHHVSFAGKGSDGGEDDGGPSELSTAESLGIEVCPHPIPRCTPRAARPRSVRPS